MQKILNCGIEFIVRTLCVTLSYFEYLCVIAVYSRFVYFKGVHDCFAVHRVPQEEDTKEYRVRPLQN